MVEPSEALDGAETLVDARSEAAIAGFTDKKLPASMNETTTVTVHKERVLGVCMNITPSAFFRFPYGVKPVGFVVLSIGSASYRLPRQPTHPNPAVSFVFIVKPQSVGKLKRIVRVANGEGARPSIKARQRRANH